MIFATLGNERHELGILMCALLTAARGIRCLYIGTEMPALDLAQLAYRVKASGIVMSFVLDEDSEHARNELRQVLANTPDEIRVWLGGLAAPTVSAGIADARLAVLPDFGSYERALDTLRAESP
jgi:methanogenic corrinoid protein MtbC1